MRRRPLRGRSDGENCGAHAHDHCSAKHAGPAAPTGLPQLIEKEETPENAEEAVGIPQGESNAETDVADGKNGERVGHGPQATRQQRPKDEMRRSAHVGPHGGCAQDQGRQTPSRKKNADDHDERNHDRGDANGDELRRRLRRAQPRSRGETAENAEELQAALPGRVLDLCGESGRRFGWHESPYEQSVNESQEQESAEKNRCRHPEMNVGEDARRAAARWLARAAAFHGTPAKGTCWPALYTGANRGNGRRRTRAKGADGWEFRTATFSSHALAARQVEGGSD